MAAKMHSPLETAIARIDELGAISDSPDHLVRTFLSPANKQAAAKILEWMTDLGMETTQAPDGTVRGILSGANPQAPPLLLGSHHDTVIDAGKYDGALGIIAALAALETFQQEKIHLPYPVHLLAFSDEEGIRFQTTYLGSRSITAPLDADTLAARDTSGITVRQAIANESPAPNAAPIRYAAGECRGYIELHIEQGRVLEEAGEPACVVTSIAGQSRLTVTLTGRADHAGTTPMPLRRDALTGAAACILAAESLAQSSPPLVITVGKIQVHPGASNSIPQSATFTIDLRHPEDTTRRSSVKTLRTAFLQIAADRHLHLDWQPIQDNNATLCDPALSSSLLTSLTSITGSRLTLPSGAGHDGVAISEICPIAMLFIRCRDGLSHHPAEFATTDDIATGIRILTHFLKSLPA
ncbi:MAG: M20 family metallo-hydrolase [Luteolibacter sp.]